VENLAIRLEGDLVVLEPLEPAHADELWAAARSPEIWQWLAHLNKSREFFDRWFELTLKAGAEGNEGPFAVRRRSDGTVIGSTRYMAARPADRVVEIGWTWFDPSAWRSGVNLETKTDARNERSRAAIAALPARFEGVLRNHMIVPDVGQRDTAYFSVLDEEWPEVRANLERRIRL
jgi:RimJ/RimL family protein N-acetyltransferase